MLTVQVRTQEDVQAVEEPEPAVSNVQYQHADYERGAGDAGTAMATTATSPSRPPPPFVRAGQKVGRNDPCPCGSGKKYKHCHGRLADVPARDCVHRDLAARCAAWLARAARDGRRDAVTAVADAPMPVNYTPPTADSLLPVPGVALGAAAAKIKNWPRDDLLRRRSPTPARSRPASSRRTASAPRR